MAKQKRTKAVQTPTANAVTPATVAPTTNVVNPSPVTAALTAEQVAATQAAPVKVAKYAPRSSFTLAQTVATVVTNPKRGASKIRFEHYKVGLTLEKCKELGLTTADFAWDLAHGLITLNPAPAAPVAPVAPVAEVTA